MYFSLKRRKNTKEQGDVGLGQAIGYYTAKGYRVSVPLTDNQAYDLIVDDDENLIRVQVKTTTYMVRGKYQCALRTNGGNMSGRGKTTYISASKVDELFVVTNAQDHYRIPAKLIAGKASIVLGKKWEEFRIRGDG